MEAKKPVVDIYCRVLEATKDAFRGQEETGKSFARTQGFTVGMIHKDIANGLTIHRTGLDLLRKRIQNRDIQGVVIFDITRLSRDTNHLAMLQSEMQSHNVTLYNIEAIVKQL